MVNLIKARFKLTHQYTRKGWNRTAYGDILLVDGTAPSKVRFDFYGKDHWISWGAMCEIAGKQMDQDNEAIPGVCKGWDIDLLGGEKEKGNRLIPKSLVDSFGKYLHDLVQQTS